MASAVRSHIRQILFAFGLVATAVSGALPAQAALAPTAIARDLFGAEVPGSHATVVEPSAAAADGMIVSAFQVGRNFGGGAAAIGFARSTDAGGSWQSGFLPGLTTWAPVPGPHARASDPVVAYDQLRGRFLVVSLAAPDLTVSSSADGVTWNTPVTASSGFLDKEWLACDGWRSSPFFGRCYLAYTRFDPPGVNLRLEVQTSSDGGASWAPSVVIPIDNSLLRFEDTLSAEPVVRPNGELVVFFFEGRRIRAVRSSDGGTTFGAREAVAELAWRTYSFAPERLRAPNIPSVAVDADGTVYAAWTDCRFRAGCSANDIVLARSSQPGAWTEPERVPLGPVGGTSDFLLPAISLQPETRGKGAHLALAYYNLSAPDCTGDGCTLTGGLATSPNAGETWNTTDIGTPMQLDWLAPTNIGRMVGDYVASAFVRGRAVGIFALAGPRQGDRFDEAAFAVATSLGNGEPPVNLSQPQVVGQRRVARTLTCSRGSWTGTRPLRFRYAWLREGRSIAGASRPAYRLSRREVGKDVACRVRATNSAGSSEAISKYLRIRP